MSKFIDGKDPGKLEMSGKVKLGVPRAKVSSTPNLGCLDKATNRGKNGAIIGK